MHDDLGDLDPTHETPQSSRPKTAKRGKSATDTAEADLLITMKQTLEDANKHKSDDEVAVFVKNLGNKMRKITNSPAMLVIQTNIKQAVYDSQQGQAWCTHSNPPSLILIFHPMPQC